MQQFNALPGPRGLPLVGNAPQLQGNPLAFMRSTRAQYGRLVRLSLAGTPVVCAYAPEHVLYCLTEHPRDFTSLQSQQRSNMREVLGEGLLTTEGEIHRQRIDQYADVMVRYTEQMLETWQPGQELELASAMQHLTLRIIVHTLFRPEPVPGHPIELLPRITLRPKHGMRVMLNPTSIQERAIQL